jgi:23S rRNA (uracil747-C5)-methyltransferase
MPSLCHLYQEGVCRSCTWIEVPYDQQLDDKMSLLARAVQASPGCILSPPVPSPLLGFRNKAKLQVSGTRGHVTLGLLQADDLDQGVDLTGCPIHHPKLQSLLNALKAILDDSGVTPYRVSNRQGELKGIIAFYSPKTDEGYLRFVARSKALRVELERLLPKLAEKFPWLKCVTLNIQPIPHALLEGPEEILLSPQPSIEHSFGDYRVRLSPQAFVQTNQAVAEELHREAARWMTELRVRHQPASFRMTELFCGQGAFSFFSAHSADAILGVEVNEAAVRSAQENSRINALSHLEFRQSRAEDALKAVREFNPTLLLVNPPRRGLGSTANWILKLAPPYLIYSSCDIDSLKNDLAVLEQGYGVSRAQLFDLFPHTPHFESLLLLSRQ